MDHWEENGIEKPQQIVICAACKYNSLILCGARHWDKVMLKQVEVLNKRIGSDNFKKLKGSDFEQGFIDQFGDFLTREQAREIVKKNGQPFDSHRNNSNVFLFSEGLY